MEYTSRGVGNAALTTGIIGTALGAVNGAGGLAGILGVGPKAQATDPGDRPVTRYEMGLFKELAEKDNEITLLKAKAYTDAKDAGIQAWAAGANATLGFMGQRIQELYGITQLVVPNANVAPGWGPAAVRPFPPFPPFPPVVPPVADTGTSTPATTTTGN